MIYSVEGKLEAIGSDYVVINTSGVGFKILTPSPQANYVGGIGQKLKLYTYMHVREDALVLFGFKTPSDLDLFQILINVTGVGPKVGLAMLSTYDSKTLATAIISGNESLLTSVPSLGKKIAARIVLELKDKLSDKWTGISSEEVGGFDSEVVDALLALGYSASEAAFAVSNLPKDTTMTLEEKIRYSLGSFNK